MTYDGGHVPRRYKSKKEAELKAKAGDSHNWSSLFMRPDAVGEAMAERYGMEKSEILDVTEGKASLAVRLAQGETHLIKQTVGWLAENGVDMEALQVRGMVASGASPPAPDPPSARFTHPLFTP